MRPLIIGPAEIDKIEEAIQRAKLSPVSIERLTALTKGVNQDTFDLKLSERPPDFARDAPSYRVAIPMGYEACISFETQPSGLCRHLSVSVDKPGKLPSPEAVEMIATAFGFPKFPPDPGRIWLEEFEPGHQAVNVVQVEPS